MQLHAMKSILAAAADDLCCQSACFLLQQQMRCADMAYVLLHMVWARPELQRQTICAAEERVLETTCDSTGWVDCPWMVSYLHVSDSTTSQGVCSSCRHERGGYNGTQSTMFVAGSQVPSHSTQSVILQRRSHVVTLLSMFTSALPAAAPSVNSDMRHGSTQRHRHDELK